MKVLINFVQSFGYEKAVGFLGVLNVFKSVYIILSHLLYIHLKDFFSCT